MQKKSLPNIFDIMGSNTVCCSFRVREKPLEQVKRNSIIQFLYSFARRIFWKKIQDFIVYLSRDICEIKNVAKRLVHPVFSDGA